MNVFHLVLTTVQRDPLLLETAARRLAVRAVARLSGRRIPLFAFADDHLHALVQTERPGLLGGHLALALRALPGAPVLSPAWFEPVTDRAGVVRLLKYILRQPEHHGLGHPADWEGTCFLDLVGARRLDGFDPTAWRALLPREAIDLVWEAVRLPAPSGLPLVGQSLGALIGAATRALGADPRLCGNGAEVVRARRVAVGLVREARFGVDAIAGALGVTERAVRRLAVGPSDDQRAARRALAIAAALAKR